MRAKITKPCTLRILNGEVEVTEQEFARLSILGLIDKEEREIPEKKIKATRKTAKK